MFRNTVEPLFRGALVGLKKDVIEGFLSVHSVGLADCNCLITGVGMQLTVHSHCPIAHIYIMIISEK